MKKKSLVDRPLVQSVTDLLLQINSSVSPKFYLQHFDIPEYLPLQAIERTNQIIKLTLEAIAPTSEFALIQLFCRDSEIIIVIEDDGGASAEATLDIQHLQKEAKALGMKMEISRVDGLSTLILVVIPLN